MKRETHSSTSHAATGQMGSMGKGHYRRLAAMAALSFAAMYVLMYAMVNALDNVLMNVNQLYMAGLMAAPMVLIELELMSGMYRNKRLNALVAAAAVVAAVAFFFGIRRQAAVGDRQFLRSMIPHHAGAILMCEQASVRDAAVKRLCQGIVASQRAEIEQMKACCARRGTDHCGKHCDRPGEPRRSVARGRTRRRSRLTGGASAAGSRRPPASARTSFATIRSLAAGARRPSATPCGTAPRAR